MRKSTHILLACLVLLAVSCSQNKFEELDRLLEQKDEIASAVKRKTDALRLSYISTPPPDRLKSKFFNSLRVRLSRSLCVLSDSCQICDSQRVVCDIPLRSMVCRGFPPAISPFLPSVRPLFADSLPVSSCMRDSTAPSRPPS